IQKQMSSTSKATASKNRTSYVGDIGGHGVQRRTHVLLFNLYSLLLLYMQNEASIVGLHDKEIEDDDMIAEMGLEDGINGLRMTEVKCATESNRLKYFLDSGIGYSPVSLVALKAFIVA
ncbi:hypothetical protein Tco_1381338, partial [Tanacetum coccineum]